VERARIAGEILLSRLFFGCDCATAPINALFFFAVETYDHDVVIRLMSKDEAKFVFEKGCEQIIIGSGQMGNVHLSPEAEAYFAKKNCKVLLKPTPEAIHVFNRSTARKIGLFHVTC
jgi:hypothetical protein